MVEIYLKDKLIATFKQDNRDYLIVLTFGVEYFIV